MNIFVLHKSPQIAAKMHCDKHVVKMILESAQMLCTVARNTLDINDTIVQYIPYKSTHSNHPCTIWVGKSRENYLWLATLFISLHKEWQYRYNHTYNHKSVNRLSKLDFNFIASKLPDIGLTPFVKVVPEQYKNNLNPIEAYRAYYLDNKANLLHYTKREKPTWFK